MEDNQQTRSGMTVRDLYELIIRIISFGYILLFVIGIPAVILNVIMLARQAEDIPLDELVYGGIAGSILSQLAFLVVAIVLFLLAPKIAPMLERDPHRPVPVIRQWSPLFATEIVLLVVGILYTFSGIVTAAPWLMRPTPPEIFQQQRNEDLIGAAVTIVLALALIFFRLPLAKLICGSLRFGAPGHMTESDAPSPTRQ